MRIPAPNRRVMLKQMGKAGLAVVVFGSACAREPATSQTASAATAPTTAAPPATSPTRLQATTTSLIASPAAAGFQIGPWTRVEMPAVSAYIVVRNLEAAIVDTGLPGSQADIGAALDSIGSSWDAVRHLIITHKHADHAGAASEIVQLAPDTRVYAGAGDIEAIGGVGDTPVTIAVEGANVFDLTIIETPGHTPGHLSVLDPNAGVLVAGDALNRNNGVLSSASADTRFTEDGTLADESVAKLAALDFEVMLFGHGDPITSDGAMQLRSLIDQS